ARHGVDDQVVAPAAAAPEVRDERLRPVRTREDDGPGQLVTAAARPAGRVAQIEAPVELPVVGRAVVDRPEVRVRRPAEGELQRARVDVARVEPRTHRAGTADPDAGRTDEAAAAAVVLEVLPSPVLIEVITPDPGALRPRALVDQTRAAAAGSAAPGHADLRTGALAVARDRDRRVAGRDAGDQTRRVHPRDRAVRRRPGELRIRHRVAVGVLRARVEAIGFIDRDGPGARAHGHRCHDLTDDDAGRVGL